ncbi:hypothetical protein ACOMD4_15845 [Streptomyces anulatus]|uniref:hypothetical protein n=1 Tax=Streptomyces anulatus TaxID=1892 RepID=UPI003B81E317
MTFLPIDNMPTAELAVHLMTSGFAITGGEEAARRLLAELKSAAITEAADLVAAYTGNPIDANAKMLRRAAEAAADPSKATRMQDAADTLTNCKEPRHG